jgi:glyoxylase-like metal-dependent hydrolase (beta-lactamase superfamily II)
VIGILFRKIAEDIYKLDIPFGTGTTCIFLIDGQQKILIDSGSAADDIDKYLLPALSEKGLSVNEVDMICNTHSHGDHVGGHKRITEVCSAKIVCFKESVPKLADPLKYSKLIRASFPEHSPLPPKRLDGVKTDIVLEEGSLLANRLEVIFTPGHDTDTICFLDRKTKTLITGDSLQGNGTSSQGLALYMNLESYRESIKKLMNKNAKNMVASHDYIMTGDEAYGENQVKKYLNKCWDITCVYDEFIKDEIKKGEKGMVNIAKSLIRHMGNTEPDKLFLPLYTVRAHIEYIKKIS